MKGFCLFLIFTLWSSSLLAQQSSNVRKSRISISNDTIILDSLSIIPDSFTARFSPDKRIADSLFRIDFAKALLFPSASLKSQADSIDLHYKVFPLKFSKTFQNLKPGTNSIDPLIRKTPRSFKSSNPFNPAGSELYTSGDLSRGVQIGSNQDASLNSNLNLQLSGKISPQFNIEAQLSDANIPIQPEGNTQQIQDFDRLYIKIYNARTQLLAGDFMLDNPEGYFLKMNKNLQGIQLKTSIVSGRNDEYRLTTRTTGAIVKGKFNRMKIQGIEGNQGPYRLIGSQGEQYIQVIAGSEKVYIDGLTLQRGEDEDYTVNYNTAEISFTPKNLITKDKRITVQFEYTERSYARFVVASDNQWKMKKGIIYFNVYNESDARNQPLLQDLSAENKSFLSQIGDDLNRARVSNFYETNFQNDRVLYMLVDSLVNGAVYQNILLYSTNPDSAKYQAGFSKVGLNLGNYIQIQSAANGQVYKWIAPINGIPQGQYEPLTQLVTPRNKQVYSLGTITQLDDKTSFKAELSLSSNDVNTFSDLDSHDNQGTGLMAQIDRTDFFRKDSSIVLNSFIHYRRAGKQFNPVEPFRAIEFERDWNLENNRPEANENSLNSGVNLTLNDSTRAAYSLDWLNYSNQYSGTRQNTRGQLFAKDFKVFWGGSLLNSRDNFRDTRFLRHELGISKDWSILKLEIKERHEGNQWSESNQESFLDGSFKFQEWQAEISNSTDKRIPWFAKILMRTDYLPDSSGFVQDYQALETSTGISLKGGKGNSTNLSANWRKLKAESVSGKDENNATIRAEEQFQLSRGALVSRTFYEIGSGLERKQDFYYLEVPQGQGYYTWADYNGNNIKELDEFEPAIFADQANYIRVFRPGNDYVPVYTNRFTQTLSLNPGRLIKKKDSRLLFLQLFNNQFSYNANRRSSRSDFINTMNPFNMEDSLIVSLQSQIRNRLSFNTKKRKFGLDYILENSANQNLMTYGIDNRNNKAHNLVSRWHIIQPLWINNRTEKGSQEFKSTFFENRNYQIDFFRNTVSLTLESSDQTRIKTEWNWSKENNLSGEEELKQHKFQLGADYQSPGKGLFHIDIQYINLDYNGLENSPTGYVMLKGFRPGHNGVANLNFRRKLNDVIQLDLSYGARISQNTGVIHTGNIAVRAVF